MKVISEKKAYLKPAVKDIRVLPLSVLRSDSGGAKGTIGWDDGTADYQNEDGLDW